MQLCRIHYDEAKASENMAVDAVMLEFGRQTGQALWRTYGWTEPALTFGYSQRWNWVRIQFPDFPGSMIRRMTGGGIVDHRRDLTYALTIPPMHPAYRQPALDLYRELHRRVAEVFLDHGHRVGLAECGPAGVTPPVAGICFQKPEPCDVIHTLTGTKLAGAAMKRTRSGILIQGSLNLQPLSGFPRQSFATVFEKELSRWLELEPVLFKGQLPVKLLIAEWERFSSPAWNHKR